MDVSRIEAISPRQIDWRKLTANEIIKYEQQGVDVPGQYLQWAQDFINSVYSDDDTTYEAAQSNSSSPSTGVSDAAENMPSDGIESTTDTASADSTTTTSETDETTPEEEKTAAQTERERLQQEGVSLRNQTLTFTGYSKDSITAVQESASAISSAQSASVSEIESLDNYMSELLAKAEETQNEFKAEIEKINEDKSSPSTFGKINKLQQELQRYGTQGQSEISATEADLTGYEAIINAQSPAISTAQDFGGETISVGNELIDSARYRGFWGLVDRIIGRNAVNVGEASVNGAQSTEELQTEALSVNSQNKSTASAYKGEVQAKTGVEAAPAPKSSNSQKSTEENGNSNTSSSNNQTSQTDGSDANATGDIDKILKAKIRKGENVDNPNV